MTDLTIASCYLGLGSFHFNHFKEMAFPESSVLWAFFSSYYVIRHKRSKALSVVSTYERVNLTDARPQELLPWS